MTEKTIQFLFDNFDLYDYLDRTCQSFKTLKEAEKEYDDLLEISKLKKDPIHIYKFNDEYYVANGRYQEDFRYERTQLIK